MSGNRKAGQGLPPVGSKANKIRIGERDDWICGLCREPIDPALSIYESDLAASVDHILPRSKGGSHEDSNLQIAHWHCNRTKGKMQISQLSPPPAPVETEDDLVFHPPLLAGQGAPQNWGAASDNCGVWVTTNSHLKWSITRCRRCSSRFCPDCRGREEYTDHRRACEERFAAEQERAREERTARARAEREEARLARFLPAPDWVIPFGRYKWKPVEVLLSDHSYCEWLLRTDNLMYRYPPLRRWLWVHYVFPTAREYYRIRYPEDQVEEQVKDFAQRAGATEEYMFPRAPDRGA